MSRTVTAGRTSARGLSSASAYCGKPSSHTSMHCRSPVPPRVVLKSTNTEYDSYERPAGEIRVVGRAIWVSRRQEGSPKAGHTATCGGRAVHPHHGWRVVLRCPVPIRRTKPTTKRKCRTGFAPVFRRRVDRTRQSAPAALQETIEAPPCTDLETRTT